MDNKFSYFSMNTTMDYLQNADKLLITNNGCLSYSTQFLPFGVNLQFPYLDTFQQQNHQPLFTPLCSFPMAHLGTHFCGIHQTWQSQNEGTKNRLMMRKVTKNKRKRASSSILGQARKGVAFRNNMEDNFQESDTENRIIPNTIYSLDGKCLKRLLTKSLKPSDVCRLGRIVLPKKEAEENLPALSNKEGIELVLKDVCTNRQWRMNYKYWYNNRSRMYILENTGNFVMHYEFQIGDSLALYGDDCKNLYVLPKKDQTQKVVEPLSSKGGGQQANSKNYNYTHKEKDDEVSFAMLIDELNQKEQESANNPLSCIIGGSSTTRLLNNDASPKKTSEEAFESVTSSSSSFQGNLDDFFEGLDMSQFGCNFFC